MPDYKFGEPWEGRPFGEDLVAIWTADGRLVADWKWTDTSYEECGDSIDPKHVARILACVNFCAGIPTEALEKLGLGALREVWPAMMSMLGKKCGVTWTDDDVARLAKFSSWTEEYTRFWLQRIGKEALDDAEGEPT